MSDSTLDNLRRCIKDTHRSMYSQISDAVEGNMEGLTGELFSKNIICNATRKSQNYSKVTDEFWASLPFMDSVQEIETHCLKFLESLQTIGGPAVLVANKLKRKWKEDVLKKLTIQFLYSDAPINIPTKPGPGVVMKSISTDEASTDIGEVTDSAVTYLPAPITIPLSPDYIKAYKRAIKNNGSLDYYLVHLMPLGPPKIGKTCFFHCLLNRNFPEGYKPRERNNKNTCDGYRSTDVATERKAIEVSTHTINSDTSSDWNEWSFNQERASIINGVHKISPSEVSSLKETSVASSADTNEGIRSITEGVTQPSTEDQAHYDETMTIFYTDLGGQPEFQEVLPALVAGPTIFLPMFSLYDDLNKKYEVNYIPPSSEPHIESDVYSYDTQFTVIDLIKECLSSIISFKDSQECNSRIRNLREKIADFPKTYPIKVCMIGTQKDLLTPGKEKEEIEQKDSILRNICTNTGIDDILEHYKSAEQLLIPIDNYDPKDGEIVRKKIIDTVIGDGDSSPFKLKIPVNWLGLELYLRNHEKPTISYAECEEVALRDFKIPKDDLKKCLYFLHHQTGTIRYFGDVKECKDIIITQPKVLFAAVTKLITLSFHKGGSKRIREFQTRGLFKTNEVKSIINEEEMGMTFDQCMALFKHLNILSPAHGLNTDDKYDFFLPCALLHVDRSPYDIEKELSVLDPLLVSFKSGFVPLGVFGGLLGHFSKIGWGIKCSADKRPLLYRNQATFFLKEEKQTVTLRKKPEYLQFFLHSSDNHTACYNIFSVIKVAINDTCHILGYMNSIKDKIKYGFNCTVNKKCIEDKDKHFAEKCQGAKYLELQCSVEKSQKILEKERCWWFKPIDNVPDHEVTEEGKNTANKGIIARFDPQTIHNGIAYIIAELSVKGTDRDIIEMKEVFSNRMKFAVYRMDSRSPYDVACLAAAAAEYDYPESCKLIVFYFTGHGGIDTWGNCVIAPNGNKDTLPINDILEPFVNRNAEIPCLFLFDCCLTRIIPNSIREFHSPIPHNSILAFATSENLMAGSKSDGSLWTRLLCERLKNHLSDGSDLSGIFGDVQEDISEELRTTKDAILNSLDQELGEMTPKKFFETLKQITEQWKYQEPFYMNRLNKVVYLEDIVDD